MVIQEYRYCKKGRIRQPDAVRIAAPSRSRSPLTPSSCETSSMAKNVLVTGSSGLIGSEAVEHFDLQGHRVTGIDNNMRRAFFGAPGDTLWNLRRLQAAAKNFTHADIDIRDRAALDDLFRRNHFDLIVHCAAQPSHDK